MTSPDPRQVCANASKRPTTSSTEVVRRPSAPLVPRGVPACIIQVYPANEQIGHRYEIRGEPLLIGRDAECQVEIDEEGVSRLHARIVAREKEYYLHDLRSQNGTFLNDEPIFLRKLSDGDFIKIGQRIFRFLGGDNIEALYHAEIARLAMTDALTGVANRRAIMEFLERQVARATRYKRPLSLILMDLDHFKAINDRWGHVAGDETLRLVCARTVGSIRSEEMFGRYGGEEFIRVLPETRAQDAYEAAERMRVLIASAPLEVHGERIQVSISTGIAELSYGDTVSQFIARADGQLYRAKDAGRNCTRMAVN